mmetsp:Transcript_12494/g.35589  ORF Transcript_12494/g.35589 Transcript_12494/m.35589 type:complete len:569 (+) Transcript_12494:74-1780(+)
MVHVSGVFVHLSLFLPVSSQLGGSGSFGLAANGPLPPSASLQDSAAGSLAQDTSAAASTGIANGLGRLSSSLGGASLGSFGPGAPSGAVAGGAAAGGPATLHRAFHYADIAAYLLQRPVDLNVEACRQACVANTTCAAWEVCAPLGDGCDGCYLVGRAPRRFSERPGWHAEILEGREDLGWDGTADVAAFSENMTADECQKVLLEANGADQSQPFHEPAIMQRYTACGFVLRDAEAPRQLSVVGQHWPTFLMTNFWDPPVTLPEEMEREIFAASGRQRRPQTDSPEGPGITSQLHATVGTRAWEEHVREKPRGPHAFVLPFYDTNIGHWMKQHGSMNPLQAYEMQSLLRLGDVVVDVGANLGCYTVPFAERVGTRGKVLAFEPFRWLQQIVSGNVAINGLSNVWVLPLGLGVQTSQFEARPPQLRFFSSPGGMKLQNQQNGMKTEESMQLYDWDSPPELITVVSLDELLISPTQSTALLGVPPVEDLRLIKIDVEGMEKEVIAGARQAIWRFKPIIWTENVAYFSSNGQDTSFLQLMNELQYTCAQAQNAPNDMVCTDQFGRGHQIGN